MPWIFAFLVLAFLASLVYTMYSIGTVAANNDSNKEIISAISTITAVNTVLMMIWGGLAFFYITSNPRLERPYVIVMLHVSLLISMISISISSIHQLNTFSNK